MNDHLSGRSALPHRGVRGDLLRGDLLRVLRFPGWLALLLVSTARAEPIDFVRDVQPILKEHCYSCHGAEKQSSGLRLDAKSKAFQGGELFGESIVPGHAHDSPLIQFVADENADLVMPPDDRLSEQHIQTLSRWVDEGAVWPDGVDLVELADPRDHWSFQPLRKPAPPEPANSEWARHEIDRFVLSALRAAGMDPAPAADRRTWLRRVSLDLIGLPPTPLQMAEFVGDDSDLAYERAVDRLLGSPRYGERWAQHWLDVVRYADTHGFEVNTERPNAWPYRDYVIRAFNRDTPYDEFVRQQIAGDTCDQDAATGFLVTASVLLPGQIGQDEPSKRLARQDALDEIVINISQTLLGLTVGCARCHDHKFDPVSQRDYYSMQAFVAGVEYEERALRTPESEARRGNIELLQRRISELDRALAAFAPLANSGTERPMVNAVRNIDRFAPVNASRLRFTIHATNQLEPCLDELEVFNTVGDNVALATAGTTVRSSGDTVVGDRHELRFVNDGHYGNSRSWMSDRVGGGWVELEFARPQSIDLVIWGRDRQGEYRDRLATDYSIEVVAADGGAWQAVAGAADRVLFDPAGGAPQPPVAAEGVDADDPLQLEQIQQLTQQRADVSADLAAAKQVTQVFAGRFRAPDKIHLLTRGDPEQPRDPLAPAVPAALGSLQLDSAADEQQRRVALANWIASPQNPLTARVMVNRIWQGHFGVGLVETPSDFGHLGQPPTHPGLLDWLAASFIESGWSIKRLHRLIVLSSTYRQASRRDDSAAAQARAQDAAVRLLWRYPARRVDAEAIRDSMLAVSGQLNRRMYGSGFDLFDKRGGLTGFTPLEQFTGDGLRRLIYAHKVRREVDAVFGAFDCPDAGQSTPRRLESTTPIQALNLFNSRFTLDQSAAFASRVCREVGDDLDQQIGRAFELAFQRQPTVDEVLDARQTVKQHGLSTLCRVLFNSNEFLFIP